MKKIMAVILAIVMLAAVGGVVVSAANRPDVDSRMYVNEKGELVFETAEDFFGWFTIDNYIELFKEGFKEYLLESENKDYLEAAKKYYGTNNIDTLIEKMWDDGMEESFCEQMTEMIGTEVTPKNYESDAVVRALYAYGLTELDIDVPEDATLEDIIAFVEYIFSEEVPTEPTTEPTTEATTEPATEPTTEPTTEATTEATTEEPTEPTTAPVIDETTVPEATTTAPAVEETTTVAETTTAAETTTKKPGTSTSPETGDPSMLLTSAFALMGAIGVVATGKRKK